MSRTNEPAIGTTSVPNYKSPPSRILRSLRKGYDNLREKVAQKSQIIQKLQGQLRDVQESRDSWKKQAKESKYLVKELQEKNEKLGEDKKKQLRNH